jgi:hypothetical protein
VQEFAELLPCHVPVPESTDSRRFRWLFDCRR